MNQSGSGNAPIAVSIGDPAGIGPELIVAAWQKLRGTGHRPFVVAGGADILRAAATRVQMECTVMEADELGQAAASFDDALPVVDISDGDMPSASYHPGGPDGAGAALALSSLQAATQWTIDCAAAALVTAPVAKGQLAKVGFGHPGQTEFLAAASGIAADEAVMMLAGPSLRTIPLTVHCALSDVPARITQELIVGKAQIVARWLASDFGIERPHMAIAALNPHAGEGGAFGHEEAEMILPAIDRLRDMGIDVSGPHPADALFTPRARSQYHAAICMYHDQALIPLKALEFDEGVNVTLGLPIIRTSPDHGTAFDIAGKGVADPGAMLAAIRMAAECADRRQMRAADA